MAKLNQTAPRPIIIGNDHTVELRDVVDATNVPVDLSGMVIEWVLKATPSGSVLLQKTGTVSGVYSATRSANTQIVTAAITDTETSALTVGKRYFAWKRTDGGSETDLAAGAQHVVQTASV